jgi:hypothetical protein
MSVAYPYTQDNCARVAQASRQAGFAEWLIGTVVAIARAESGCNPGATNISAVEHSVGPFQINLRAHPQISESCARDFECSARIAYDMSGGGQNFSPWSAFTSGAYRAYLSVADIVTGVPSGASSISGSDGGFAAKTAPAPLVRLVVTVTVLVLIVLGIAAIRGKPIREIGVSG